MQPIFTYYASARRAHFSAAGWPPRGGEFTFCPERGQAAEPVLRVRARDYHGRGARHAVESRSRGRIPSHGYVYAEVAGHGVPVSSAAITKHHRHFLSCSGLWEIKVLDNLVPSENPPPGLQVVGHLLAVFSCGSKSASKLSGVFLITTRILSNQGPILITLFNVIAPRKTVYPNTVTLQVGASTYEFWWRG